MNARVGINVELVKARASEIRDCLAKLRKYTAVPDDAFFADERNGYTVQHLLLVAIEAAAALCNHLVAHTARTAPATYAECFDGLVSIGLIDAPLRDRLAGMVRFRNLLVHRYWEIDPHRVLGYARNNLGDFEDYLAAIGEWLAEDLSRSPAAD